MGNKCSKYNLITGDYLLQNLRIETGFEFDGDKQRDSANIVGTQTSLMNILVREGQIALIKEVGSAIEVDPQVKVLDANGMLLLPAFKDMHTHLDKSLYGLPWQAVVKNRTTVYDMIAYEQEVIPTLLKSSVKRSTQLIQLMQGYGTNFARSHFNIEPSSGMQSLENLLVTLEGVKDSFEAELVAFPQHGVFYTKTAPLLKQAVAHPSVDFVGGVDPYGVDGDIEKVLDYTVGLALDYNKGIDLHLHDSGEKGINTLQYLIKLVEENPILKAKTFVSHAYVLSDLKHNALDAMAEALAGAQIGIVSAIPLAKSIQLPVPVLNSHGVKVLVGTDNIQDHWSTFGSGNMLEQIHYMARLYGWQSEYELSRALGYATGGVLPLSDKGDQLWPKAGDKADFILVDASVTAEAVARRTQVGALAKNGNLLMFDKD